MTPSRFTPEQMRERAAEKQQQADEFTELVGPGFVNVHAKDAAMLRQSASDAEALADLQRKVKEYRQTLINLRLGTVARHPHDRREKLEIRAIQGTLNVAIAELDRIEQVLK
jgi:hypothetical protein